MGRITSLLWLRYRLWRNGLRSGATAADQAAAVVFAVIGVVLALVLAVALGAILRLGVRGDDIEALEVALLIVFWMFAFLAVVMPLFFSFGQQNVPTGRLLVFPFSVRGLYRISLTASFSSSTHLFWYPALLSATIVVLVVSRPAPAMWFAFTGLFAICLVVWCHALLLMVQLVVRRRSVKELVATTIVVVVVVASMIPSLVESRKGEAAFENLSLPGPIVTGVSRTASVFPPSIAAAGLVAAESGEVGRSRLRLAALGFWALAGIVLGERLFRQTVVGGGGRSQSPGSGTRSVRASGPGVDRLVFAPAASRAVAARELLYLLRSVSGKFSIAVMPVFVAAMGLVVARDMTGSVLGLDRSGLVFLGVMLYCSMFTSNFVYNAYAFEGAGIRAYFNSPAPARQLVFGKNLGVWLFSLVLVAECLATYAVVVGPPPISIVVSGCLAFALALLTSTAAGNFVSPALPVARDPSKLTNSASQIGILVSFGVLLANVLLVGGLAAVSALTGSRWLLAVLLAAVTGIVGLGYRILLDPASRLLEKRRESLIEAVQ